MRPRPAGRCCPFLICIVMATLPSWIRAAGESLFGVAALPTRATLGYGGRGANYDDLLAAVFTIVALVGLVAFIKGVFMLRGAADGKPGAGAGRAFAHMVGGIAGWHIIAVVQAVQNSLGMRVLSVN